MRDAQALQLQLRVDGEARAEVVVEQLAIGGAECIQRERLAGLLHLVGDFLELGEHGLPVDRAADVVDLAVDQIGAHLGVAGLLEQMMGEELLVEGRGDLREENRVIVVLESWCVCEYQVCMECPASCASV